MDKMRKTFVAGLDAAAMTKVRMHVADVTRKCSNGRSLLEYAAIHDYNPMISRTFAMRYACRQKGCGFIPKSETDWIIATQHGIAREYWFCAACGGEFRYNLGSGGLDSRGQDKPYQHVIFMQIPWGTEGDARTMCARAVEPTASQNAAILALKCVTAVSGISVPAGAKRV